MRNSTQTQFPTIQKKGGSFRAQKQNSYNSSNSNNPDNNQQVYYQQQQQANQQIQNPRKSVGSVPFGNQNLNSKEFLTNFSQKLDKHEGQIEARNQVIAELEQSLIVLKQEFIKEKKKISEKDVYISQLHTQFQQFESKNKEMFIVNQELQTKILHYEREISKLQQKQGNSSKEGQEKQLLMSQISDLNKLLENEKQQKESQEQELQNMKQRQDIIEKENQNLKQKEIQQNENIKSQICQTAQIQKQADDLEKQVKVWTNKFQDLEKQSSKKVDELKMQVTSLEKDLLVSKSNVNVEKNLRNQVEQMQLQLKDNLQKINDLEFQLKDKNNDELRIQELEKNIEQTKKEYSQKFATELENSKIQFKKDLDFVKERLKEQENKNKLLSKDIQNLEKSKQELTQKVGDINEKDEQLKRSINILDNNEKEIMKSLKCNHCNNKIKEPVTVIPCGHNFCLGCKTAYNKQCIKCGPKVKIEAMYRNELLDDILNMVKVMQNTRDSLKQLQSK